MELLFSSLFVKLDHVIHSTIIRPWQENSHMRIVWRILKDLLNADLILAHLEHSIKLAKTEILEYDEVNLCAQYSLIVIL